VAGRIAVRERLRRRTGCDLGFAIFVAAAAVALLAPTTAGAARISYGIKSAELRVTEKADEYWGGGERHLRSRGVFELAEQPGEQVGSVNLNPKADNSGGFIAIRGRLSGYRTDYQTEEGETTCNLSGPFSDRAWLELDLNVTKSGKVVIASWYPPADAGFGLSGEHCGGAFGGAFDAPFHNRLYPAAKFDNKTFELDGDGTSTQGPNRLAQEEGVGGSQTVEAKGKIVLRRLPKEG
jgi:hypothetical protein